MKTPESKHFNEQIYDEASSWLVEFRSGDIDAAGRKEFYHWLLSSPEHMRAYLELTAIWNEGHVLDAGRVHDDATLLAAARSETNVISLGGSRAEATPTALARAGSQKTGLARRIRFAVAACFSIVTLGGLGWYGYVGFVRNVYTTSIGEQRRIILTDGSVVELDAQSKIRIRFRDHERDVDLLEGQALFQVAHDAARPFVVHTEDVKVRAVGTQFDVYRKAGGTTVTVIEGKVAVLPAGRVERPEEGCSPTSRPPCSSFMQADAQGSKPLAHGGPLRDGVVHRPAVIKQNQPLSEPASTSSTQVFLSAGEQAVVTAQAAIVGAQPDVTTATAWTRGRLTFQGASLQEVVTEFNRYNARRLLIRDSELAALKVTGMFSSTEPAALIRFLEARSEIRVIQNANEIVIDRRASAEP